MLYSCGHVSESPSKICPLCGQGKPQDGRDAYERGKNHADSVYQTSGIAPLKGWLKYKPSNDYERGRLDRAKEILKAMGR
ncbi:MAG: hypothetical protein LYZ69_04850 [Nitrososphaerales archaeon]|nr:hypothetical protein [Nitrososphaerales archaeon]